MTRRLTQHDLDSLDAASIERDRLSDLFEIFKARQAVFSAGQWAAIRLVYAEGMSRAEAGNRLGVSAKAISGRLERARQCWEQSEAEQRREITRLKMEILRENMD